MHCVLFQNKLGILEKGEINLGEMIDTMSTFQGYCPVTDDGTIHQLPLGGDGLSVALALKSKICLIHFYTFLIFLFKLFFKFHALFILILIFNNWKESFTQHDLTCI